MLLLFLYVTSCTALSIGATINKSELNESKEFYPNWVPFKNKHGDELGEFLDVAPKGKVKKRLAPPMNFILRAVAEPDGDDYYDKGQGEGDNEDYFEKKDWSDLNRPVQAVDTMNQQAQQNLSDIEGIVHLITQPSRHNLAKDIQESIQDSDEKEGLDDNGITEKVEALKNYAPPVVKSKAVPKIEHKYEDDIDYEDSPQPSGRRKSESSSEEAENEMKKKNILDSVDELKDRHAEEQRTISEKAKQEEFDTELHEQDQMQTKNQIDKYAERTNKRRPGVTSPDYDEYDEKGSWRDKYNVKIDKTTTENAITLVTIKEPKKLSVFKSPHLYIIDDSEEVTASVPSTTPTTPVKVTKNPIVSHRFSARFTTSTEPAMQLETFIEPETIKDSEPTLFFPKLKHKRRRKLKLRTEAPAPDSSAAETAKRAKKLTTKATETPAPVTTDPYLSTTDTDGRPKESRYVSIPDEDYNTTINDFVIVARDGIINDAASTKTDTFTDAVPAATENEKEESEKEPKEYHEEKGGGREHHSSHEEEHEEHGKKAYEGLHKDSKSKKGHHDKEDHLGKYEDHGGYKKEHSDEKKHYGSHHHDEHGKKHAKYEESGKHSKGHSTKGSHDIHKKEEYEKKVEFFEEEGDSAEEEKHGGFHNEKEHKAGGKFAKGKLQANHEERRKGESGHYDKGAHSNMQKGYKASGGRDHHGRHENARQAAEGHQEGKKWVYHHGFPAKTSNLVIIDRRGDKYAHGPTYFG